MNRIRNILQAFVELETEPAADKPHNGNGAIRDALASVTVVPVGHDDDGLIRRSGTPIDKTWAEHLQEMSDARDAWRHNPLARRIVGLTTSYTVGAGITLQSAHQPLQRFVDNFCAHNDLSQRIDEWSDELARSGELFPVLFTNPVSGMSTVRVVPACLIDAVDYDEEDYERELRYREMQPAGAGEKWWRSAADAPNAAAEGPVMLHFAVNRPTGALRGESDLAPILPWLRRYNRWLEDRVRLNAAVRSFLWIVHAPARLRNELQERYRTPPAAGSVIIAEQGTEEWSAVTPNLHAADAEKDGRAMRWMIVAGGPGTALLDIGEGEDSNLATGKAMAEQRRRFLRRRQAYLAYILKRLTLVAWERSLAVRGLPPPREEVELTAVTPDISPEDNLELATAASQLTAALTQLGALTSPERPPGPAFRRTALRLFTKFLGEQLSESEITSILEEGEQVK